ncbi:MAG TPA: response regulator transcription factor [Acidimicrobiia bacterium]
MSGRIRVVIAEDHYLFREGTRQLLETSGGIEVVAAVGDARALHEAVGRLEPDAAVVDIRMPPDHETEGIDAARKIRAEHPNVGVVVLSQYANALYAFELFQDGTQGLAYLLKDRVGDVDELVRAVVTVIRGGSVIDPNVVESLLTRKTAIARGSLDELTDRETEVLAEMAQGKSNAAISETLFISESAVEKHINSILMKLGLDPNDSSLNRRVAAVLAFLHSYQPSDNTS